MFLFSGAEPGTTTRGTSTVTVRPTVRSTAVETKHTASPWPAASPEFTTAEMVTMSQHGKSGDRPGPWFIAQASRQALQRPRGSWGRDRVGLGFAPALLTWPVHPRSLCFLIYKMGLITAPAHLLVAGGLRGPRRVECWSAWRRLIPESSRAEAGEPEML